VKEVGDETIDIIVVRFNVIGSHFELVLVIVNTKGSKGISAVLSKGKLSGLLRIVDGKVVRLEILLTSNEIKAGTEDREIPGSGDEFAVVDVKGLGCITSHLKTSEVIEACLIERIEKGLRTFIISSKFFVVEINDKGLSRVVELGDVEDKTLVINVILFNLKGVKVVFLSTKTISGVGTNDNVEGKFGLNNGGLFNLSDAETERSGSSSSSEVADGNVEASGILVAAFSGDETELVVAVLSRCADIVVAIKGTGKGLGLNVNDSGSVDELSLDDDTTTVGFSVLGKSSDINEEGSETLRLSINGGDSVFLSGEGRLDNVDLRSEIGGSERIDIGISTNVADAPLDRV